MDLVVGVLLGVVSSLVAWAAIALLLRPKLAMSTFISKVPDSSEGRDWRYRIKVQNKRRWRSVVDIRFEPRFLFAGLIEEASSNVLGASLPARGGGNLPGLRAGKDRIFTLDIRSISVRETAVSLPVVVRRSVVSGEATLEDLFDSADDVRLVVWLIATDSFSGRRRASFHEFRGSDILPFWFEKHGVGVGRPVAA